MFIRVFVKMESNFKLFPIVVLLFNCVWSRSTQYSTNTDMRFIKICNETSTISLAIMNEVLIHKKLSGEESNEFKCFLHCLFTKYGWMDEDGGFFLTEIRSVLEETSIDSALLEYILYKCTANSSVDRCQRAFQFTECFWHKIKNNHVEEDESFLYNFDEVKK